MGNAVRNPQKTIKYFDIHEIPGGLRLAVYASGFLYRQVRHMVGAIIGAGLGTVSKRTILEFLALGSSVPLTGTSPPPPPPPHLRVLISYICTALMIEARAEVVS